MTYNKQTWNAEDYFTEQTANKWEEAHSTAAQELEEVKASISKIENDIDDIDLDELDLQVAKNTQQISGLQPRVSMSELDIDSLKTRVETIENDTDGIGERIENNEDNIQDLYTRWGNNRYEISQLKPRISSVEEDVTNILQDISDIETELAGKMDDDVTIPYADGTTITQDADGKLTVIGGGGGGGEPSIPPDTELSETSTNAVQNKVITARFEELEEDINNIGELKIPAYMNYSTNERIVGKWTDGKPLYQKTYVIDTTTTLSVNISDLNYEYINWDIVGGNSSYKAKSYYKSSSDYFQSYLYNSGKSINIQTVNDYKGTAYVIIQYTKTTDSPDQLVQSVINNDLVTVIPKYEYYSEEEKVIGRWVDGKPLYQKVFNKTGNYTSGQSHEFAHNIQNIDTVCRVNFIVKRMNSDKYENVPNTSGSSYISRFVIDETNVNYVNQSGDDHGKMIVILQYTKTTDTASDFIYESEQPITDIEFNEAILEDTQEVIS